MPRGREFRRGRRVINFLKPCLLVALCQDETHGYNLVDELERFGFHLDGLDPSLVYRSLRDLEENGWVSSLWDKSGQGPQRRVYSITEEGERHLAEWVEDLRRTRKEIDYLLASYEEVVSDPILEAGAVEVISGA